ncbi:MAG TPA: BrnT family toxin [Blastocatellia bacterium]|nr:BrnT family toxin [Blastocatellia bacterium]
MTTRFEWDENKAASNLDKHGVSFDEASTVFDDPSAKIFDDETHSISEYREIIIGHSINGQLMLVGFTERPKDIIRIISARLPTRRERKDHEENSDL